MSSIFPIRETVSLDTEREPRLVELDEETADEVFEALASRTTREIFLALHRQPQTASDLAEVTDTSVQNVQYHLEKLTESDLVEVVDTWYSERGSEMKVYAPEDESLVLFAGRDKGSTFRQLLNRLVGVFAVLVPPSVLVGWLANRSASDGVDQGAFQGPAEQRDGADDDGAETMNEPEEGGDGATTDQGDAGGDGADAGGDATPTPEDITESDVTPTPEETPTPDGGTPEPAGTPVPEDQVNETFADAVESTPQMAADAADGAAEIAGLDPGIAAGLAFFLGGLFVYAVISYRSRTV